MTETAPAPAARRPLWRRLVGYNLLTAALLGIGGWYLGWYLGHHVASGASLDYFGDTGENDIAVFMGYTFGVLGFLAGMGFLQYPLARLRGYPPSLREKETEGIGRYFGLCTDHKVVGLQYLYGIGLFFFIGGLNAMLIRVQLLRPTPVFNAGNYLTLVGMHGTMMMGMMTSAILGPFANYFVPIMIGARRMAFPRIEALTFWLLMAGGGILVTTVFFGGFPTGWTGYAPLNDQANAGMDSFIMFFALVGVSMCLLGLNMIATVVTMRAPGMTWSRLPIFVWAVISTSILNLLAAPVLIAALAMVLLDRTAQTTFFLSAGGGSSYLYENLFWFFGHPEVYILAIPGFGVLLELLPVFSRKPLWGYRLAVAGMLGVTLLSFLVWQHHLFMSGINSNLRPFYMLSTELISIPTGFTFLCGLMTLWRGSIRFTVPMLFCPRLVLQLPDRRALGVLQLGHPERHDRARQLLRDGPLPLHDHGRADLHILRRDLLLAPEDDGLRAERAAREDPLLGHVHRLQLDLCAAVRGRIPRSAPPRRRPTRPACSS